MKFECTEVAVVSASSALAAEHGNELQLALTSAGLLRQVALMVVVRVSVLAGSAAELSLATLQFG